MERRCPGAIPGNAIVAHNFFGRVSEELVVPTVAHRSFMWAGANLLPTGNHNCQQRRRDQGKPIFFEDAGNVADYNVYVSTQAGRTAMKDAGEHSVAIQGDRRVRRKAACCFPGKAASSLPTAPILKGLEVDFFGARANGGSNVPGPFLGLANPVTLRLRTIVP